MQNNRFNFFLVTILGCIMSGVFFGVYLGQAQQEEKGISPITESSGNAHHEKQISSN